jgi:penicillin-binding protein 1A
MAASPVAKVETPDGKVLEDVTRNKGKKVLDQNIADQVNDVLEGVIQGGTGTGADIGRPNGTAGKTGTSEDYGDAWFVGYTPELSTAIWMGFSDSRQPLTNIKGASRVYGGTFAAPTWKAYMTDAAPELGLTDFAKPVPPTTTTVYRPYDPNASTSASTTLQTGPTTPTTRYVFPTLPPSPPTTRATSPTSIYRAPPTTRRPFTFP